VHPVLYGDNELVREDRSKMGLRERTFGKVHGLTWINSVHD
jgi:hypothetical protein